MTSFGTFLLKLFYKLKPNPWDENKEYVEVDPSVIISPISSVDIMYNTKSSHICIKIKEQSQIMGNLTILRSGAKIEIGKRTQISGSIFCAHTVEIGDDVLIAGGTIIWDNDSHSVFWKERENDVIQCGIDYRKNPDNWILNKDWTNVHMAPVIIKNKVWIGFNAAILKGVTIGEGAVIGAMSVITHDVPPYTIVAGNPARIIRKIHQVE